MMQIGTPAPPPFAPQGREHLPPGVHDHERSDASVRLIFYVVLAMIVGAILAHFFLYLYLRGLAYVEPFGLPQPQPPADLRALPPPKPRLQIDEAADLARVREQEDANIAGYGWIDKARGVVHMPVARA